MADSGTTTLPLWANDDSCAGVGIAPPTISRQTAVNTVALLMRCFSSLGLKSSIRERMGFVDFGGVVPMQPAGEQSFVSRHFLLSTKTAVIVSLIRVRVNVKEFSSGS